MAPVFVDTLGDELLARLRAERTDLVVEFAPHRLPAALPREVDAITVACVDRTIPLRHGFEQDPWQPRDDLEYALRTSGGLGDLVAFDAGDYDRVIAADPLLPRLAPE